jgi:hypothetical protein
MLQLLDLGVVASARLSGNKEVQTAPTKIGQFFAPGLFFGSGIGNSPAAVLVGYEIAPQSRSTQTQTGSVTNTRRYDASRFLFGLTIDVPLFSRPFTE